MLPVRIVIPAPRVATIAGGRERFHSLSRNHFFYLLRTKFLLRSTQKKLNVQSVYCVIVL